MRPIAFAGALAVGLSALFGASRASSNPLPTSAEHVATPGRIVSSDDTADAIVVNPANLAWIPAPELRWTWVRCPDDAVTLACGHAWEVATPLFFGLSTGFRVDLVQPPWGSALTEGVGFPYRGSDYVWITWALATQIGQNLAFGFSLQKSISRNLSVDGLFGISAALSWRPDPHLAFAVVARDFNRPSQTIQPSLTPDVDPAPILDGRYAGAVTLRPTGRRNVEIGLETQYWQGVDQWIPRATVAADVPGLGRAFASVAATHLFSDSRQGILGTAGLELHFDGLSLGGGALFGSGLGSSDPVAEYGTLAVAGYTQPGIPAPTHAVWIRLESTPSVREHVALLRTLWRLANASDIDGVTLVVRAEPASSFAHAEEIADGIRFLRAHGKKVLCSWEDAGPKGLYACASADRIVVTPSGGLRYAGLHSDYMYLKGLLDKIGIEGDFIRIGPHKTAPEQFTNEHPGPVANEDHIDMLRQQEAVFDRNLSLYRHMTEQRVRDVTRTGPFVATEARDAGFVDGFAFDDELETETQRLIGKRVSYQKYEAATRAPDAFGSRPKLALIYLEGDIVDGHSQQIPLLDMRLVGSYTIAEAVRDLRDDPSVRAVVLRIESPGGSSLASDVMWRELVLLAKKKPLIVSMGTVAASGGYYVASASKHIFALPLTITGSIGVFYGKADVSGLLGKVGINIDTYKTAPRADAESIFRGFSPDEERELHHKVEQFYDTFLDRVSQGRSMSKAAIDAVGRGRVWMGQQALVHGLVDHLGGLREALDAARRAGHLPDDAPIVELPREKRTLVQMALDAVGLREEGGASEFVASLPPAIQSLARALAPLVIFRDDEPLARMEYVEVGP
jgi:protease-4